MFVPCVQVGYKGHFLFCFPPTLDDHIFRVRTPFGVLLYSMEIPLSQDSFHVPVEGSGVHNLAENLCLGVGYLVVLM